MPAISWRAGRTPPRCIRVELANENMLTTDSYEAAFSVLGDHQAASRRILMTNSFWGYFVDALLDRSQDGP